MKKAKRASKKNVKTSGDDIVEEVIERGEGKFHFVNGDSYEGEYIVVNNEEIYRHGFGIYKTSNLDEYRAMWERNIVASHVHIIYSNKAEYKGEYNTEGEMDGKGTYIFPDGSTLTAIWRNNEPSADFLYTDPLGYNWQGEHSTNEESAIFTPENYVWREDND